MQFVRKWYVTIFPLDTHIRIAALRGWLHCALTGIPQHVRDNLQVAFPELEPSEIDRIARSHCEFFRRIYLWRVLPCLPGSTRPENWRVEGRAHLDAALARNRGVLLVTAHFGYAHIIPTALAAHGYPVARVTAELNRLEERDTIEKSFARGSRLRRYVYPRTRVLADSLGPDDMVANLDVRPIFERLSHNGIVMTTGDGLRSLNFSNLPLLGKLYPFPNGLMKIATLAGASVLPAFAVQDGRYGKIRIEIHPALPVDARLDVKENVRLLAEAIEEQLRARPHLWYRWMVANWFQVALELSSGDRKTRYKSKFKQKKGIANLRESVDEEV